MAKTPVRLRHIGPWRRTIGLLFLEYRDEVGKRNTLAVGHDDFTRGKLAANELAANLLKGLAQARSP